MLKKLLFAILAPLSINVTAFEPEEGATPMEIERMFPASPEIAPEEPALPSAEDIWYLESEDHTISVPVDFELLQFYAQDPNSFLAGLFRQSMKEQESRRITIPEFTSKVEFEIFIALLQRYKELAEEPAPAQVSFKELSEYFDKSIPDISTMPAPSPLLASKIYQYIKNVPDIQEHIISLLIVSNRWHLPELVRQAIEKYVINNHGHEKLSAFFRELHLTDEESIRLFIQWEPKAEEVVEIIEWIGHDLRLLFPPEHPEDIFANPNQRAAAIRAVENFCEFCARHLTEILENNQNFAAILNSKVAWIISTKIFNKIRANPLLYQPKELNPRLRLRRIPLPRGFIMNNSPQMKTTKIVSLDNSHIAVAACDDKVGTPVILIYNATIGSWEQQHIIPLEENARPQSGIAIHLQSLSPRILAITIHYKRHDTTRAYTCTLLDWQTGATLFSAAGANQWEVLALNNHYCMVIERGPTANYHNRFQVINLSNGTIMRTFAKRSYNIQRLNDHQIIMQTSNPYTLIMYDISSGQIQQTPFGEGTAIPFVFDDHRIIDFNRHIDNTGTFRIYNVSPQTLEQQFSIPTALVIRYVKNNLVVASEMMNHKLILFNFNTARHGPVDLIMANYATIFTLSNNFICIDNHIINTVTFSIPETLQFLPVCFNAAHNLLIGTNPNNLFEIVSYATPYVGTFSEYCEYLMQTIIGPFQQAEMRKIKLEYEKRLQEKRPLEISEEEENPSKKQARDKGSDA